MFLPVTLKIFGWLCFAAALWFTLVDRHNLFIGAAFFVSGVYHMALAEGAETLGRIADASEASLAKLRDLLQESLRRRDEPR